MIKFTFKRQLMLGIMLIILGNVLAFVFHRGILANIAWVVYGLLFLVNPVYPEWLKNRDSKKAEFGARIAGVLCILIGMLIEFVV